MFDLGCAYMVAGPNAKNQIDESNPFIDFAVDRIADIFGNDIRQSVGRSIVTAWVTDPWTLGSYACAIPGQIHQCESLPLAIDNKLFFAGEATARANGTCNGAYWSGVRAAREVAEVLN